MSSLIQKHWPQWKPVQTIGKGASGVVYRAVNTELGTGTAAIKVISIPASLDEIEVKLHNGHTEEQLWEAYTKIKDQCVKEIETMMSLKDSLYVLHLEDYKVLKQQDTIGYIILLRMELCESLDRYVKHCTMGQEQVIRLGIDLCRGLEACQNAKQPILHRDIKPENIFYHKDGIFKLGDFGIARPLNEQAANMTQGIGTVTHIAPEVCHGGEYDARADLYSLGLVLYGLMNENAGPFLSAGASASAVAEAHRKRICGEKLPAPANADGRFSQVILKACAFKPEKRFPNATAFREALEQLLAAPITGAATELPPKPTQVGSFGPKKKIWPILLLLLLLGGLVAFLLLKQPSETPNGEGPASTQAETKPSQSEQISTPQTEPGQTANPTTPITPTLPEDPTLPEAPDVPEYDGKTKETAIPITLQETQATTLDEESDWERWYKLETTGNASNYFFLFRNADPTYSVVFSILDEQFQKLAGDWSRGGEKELGLFLQTNTTYWLKVTGDKKIQTYEFTVKDIPCDAGISRDEALPITVGTEYEKSISVDGETDWFSFTTGETEGLYRIYINTKINDNPISGKTTFILYNASGIKQHEQTIGYDDDGYIDLLLPANTTYTIKVSAKYTIPAIGDYLLCVSHRANSTNITPETAVILQIGKQITAKMDSSVKRYYVFTAPTDGRYTINVHNIDVGCSIDFRGEHGTGNIFSERAKNEDTGSRTFAAKQGDRIQITLDPEKETASGTFIIEILEA